jgi:hypothetical protein
MPHREATGQRRADPVGRFRLANRHFLVNLSPDKSNNSGEKMDWDNPDFDDLASELRQQVGGEFRLEAEAVEDDARRHALRRRTLQDVAFELMNRGDEVGATGAGVSLTGTITHVAGDLAIIQTPHSLANVNLAGLVSLRVLRRNQEGGQGRANGSPSYRSRMLELELSGEFIEIFSSVSDSVTGTISAVGADHIVVVDRNQTEWFIPLSTIVFTLQH